MKIRMLKTKNGSPDGMAVLTYAEDRVYELPEDLARVFIKQKWAKRLRTTKDAGAAPENKKSP